MNCSWCIQIGSRVAYSTSTVLYILLQCYYIRTISYYCFMCRVVKLTSPNLNYVIVFGAAMLMIGCIFVASPSEDIVSMSKQFAILFILTWVSYLVFKNLPESWIWYLFCCGSRENHKSGLYLPESLFKEKGESCLMHIKPQYQTILSSLSRLWKTGIS